ncbi:ABC transporter ATP-binding protein [Streptomyces sp. NBC_01205]|uniref:ABC transporter ATP-binding protein n=1 Tax=Streptomyces sp. NBC_01205 TaxID=2903771 RepID=UPI002E14F134|nr:ABC transporter ATP-binding protein/permease [Streptomyces sp. NBC_01205]
MPSQPPVPGGERPSRRGSPLLAMLGMLPSVSLPLTGLLLFALVGAALAPVALTIANGRLVDVVSGAAHGQASALRQVTVLAILIALGFLLQQLLVPVAQQSADVLGRRLTRQLRDRVMAASLTPTGIGHLEDTDTLDLVTGAQGVGTAGFTPRDALIATANIGVARLQAVACAALIAVFHWWLALALLAGFAVLTSGAVADYRRGQQALMGTPARLRRPSYVRDFARDPDAAKEIRVFGLRDWLDLRFHQEWRVSMAGLWQTRRDGRLLMPALTAGVMAVQLGGFTVLGLAASSGDLSAGRFTAYAGALLGLSAVMGVSPDNVKIDQGAAAIPLVRALERALPPVPAPVRAASVSTAPVPTAPAADRPFGGSPPAIRFEAVDFRYAGRSEPVFCGFDLDIPAGRSLAVVGVNGAGKSTLVKLLSGMYRPQAGRILIDGVPLAEADTAGWQRRIGAVFQDFVHYELSAADNVGLGAVEHLDDMEGMRTCADQAGASELIDRLDHGWQNMLSAGFPGGRDLSGGEWQRLALARALFAVRHGARLLILDEPASALDVRAEAELNDRFLSLTEGVTSVLISHRFSTTRRADRIVVLEHGTVLESGSHDDLVAADGAYARMFRIQADRFDGPRTGGEARA